MISLKTYSIYEKYKLLIEYHIQQRETVDEELHSSINMNILLCCACYIEGYLECKLKEILQMIKSEFDTLSIPESDKRRMISTTTSNLIENIYSSIGLKGGWNYYVSNLEALLGKKYPKSGDDSEAIDILFSIRNVIAHGTEITYYESEGARLSLDPDNDMTIMKPGLNSGYKKFEEYLTRKKIINTTFSKEGNLNYLFSDDVVDHFWSCSMRYIVLIDDYVKAAVRDLYLKDDDFLKALFFKKGFYRILVNDELVGMIEHDESGIHKATDVDPNEPLMTVTMRVAEKDQSPNEDDNSHVTDNLYSAH